MSDFIVREFNYEVGVRIAVARKRLGWTQERLSKALGIPRATFANLEGGRQRIGVDVLWRIAAVLDLPLSVLVPERDLSARPAITAPPIGWDTNSSGGNFLPFFVGAAAPPQEEP